jgi:hypothetical protein
MTAKGSAAPRTAAPRKRPTAAEVAAKNAQIEELRRQLDARPAGLPAAAAPAQSTNGHGSPFTLIDLDDGAEPEPLRRAPLFKAGGKTYSMVTNPPPQWGFEALALAGGANGFGGEAGMAASQVFVLRMMLGNDGLRALRDRESIKPEKLTQIMRACSQAVYGAMEPPKTS